MTYLKNDRKAYLFLKVLGTYGLQTCVNIPTRVTDKSSTAIANVLTYIPPNNYNVQVLRTLISYHYAKGISLNNNCKVKKVITSSNASEFRVFNETNALLLLLKNTTWTSVMNAIDVNERYKNFINIFTDGSETKN